MNTKEFNSIQSRISELSEYIKTPESSEFNTDEIFSCLSDKNKEFLSPLSNHLNIYLNCLKSVTRWKNHIYSDIADTLNDNDYDHVLEMLKINYDLRKTGLASIDFDTVELMILIHDGGEIITDDISSNSTMPDSYIQRVKELEPKVFAPLVLRQIKDKNLFDHRKTLNQLYQRYESRHQNPADKESHLVKLIDMCQGNAYGLEKIYHQIPVYPENIISNLIHKEKSLFELISNNLPNQPDKDVFASFYFNKHFSKFSRPQVSPSF